MGTVNMNQDGPICIGADPGGKGSFGIAILTGNEPPQTASASCADEAVAFVKETLSGRVPAGVGVDAPLWWSSGPSGDRAADGWLRTRYKGRLSSGAVQTANSLRGAALTQGAMFVQRLRESYPDVPVTESHPKVLLVALAEGNWQKFADDHKLPAAAGETEHIRDALIAAVSAREGFQGRWPKDLSIDRRKCEQNPHTYWLGPVHYYWPQDHESPLDRSPR